MTDRIQQLANRRSYLAKLRLLLRREVNAVELLSLSETEERAKQQPAANAKNFRVPFDWLSTSAFDLLIRTLATLNPSPVILWVDKARICGALEVPSLTAIDFSFPFEALPEGIMVVTTSDARDKMVLDFYEEDGLRYLDVELHGAGWPSADLAPPVPTSRTVH
ncbi:hypothetical protein GCM10007276_34110 [Agaricicola taiwanensis]|uniref:Uncharacterized protein n=1 Tax=Agaricicola taiwanensis TaxID=591372 RepID=A0A8J2YN11_9RHOB|nr:hypothetical protein [Agaricicola taiwanensis]GGE54222.1 hypothetical protein GCM10007276_34110 [Agaricicola taiwanensis]